jgi:hypothetical protein
MKINFDVVDANGIPEMVKSYYGRVLNFIEHGSSGGNPNFTAEFSDREHAIAFLHKLYDGTEEDFDMYIVEEEGQ